MCSDSEKNMSANNRFPRKNPRARHLRNDKVVVNNGILQILYVKQQMKKCIVVACVN